MNHSIIPLSTPLEKIMADPFAHLVKLYGEQGAHAFLYGGDTDGGYWSGVDVIPEVPGTGRTIDGQNINDIWNEMQADLAAFNRVADTLTAFLTFPVRLPTEQVGIPVGVRFEEATEFGRPGKASVQRISRAFPLKHYDQGDGFTQEFIDSATGAELLAVAAEIRSGWVMLRRNLILEALFGSSNWTSKEGLNIVRLYNNDGEVPPAYKRWTHSGTHTHYLANLTLDSTQLDAMEEHLVHHGFSPDNGSTLVLFAHRTDLNADIRGLTKFVPVGTASQATVINGEVIGAQRSAPGPFRAEGTHGLWTVVENNDIPAGYLLGVAVGGQFVRRNPVGLRGHNNPSIGRALRLIEGNRQEYPLYDSVWDGYMGAGVGQRGSAVVFNKAASYTDPTFDSLT